MSSGLFWLSIRFFSHLRQPNKDCEYGSLIVAKIVSSWSLNDRIEEVNSCPRPLCLYVTEKLMLCSNTFRYKTLLSGITDSIIYFLTVWKQISWQNLTNNHAEQYIKFWNVLKSTKHIHRHGLKNLSEQTSIYLKSAT